MTANKTTQTKVRVEDFIARVEHPKRRSDAHALLRMMREVTGQEAAMWGPSIIGFGRHHYIHSSGREGDTPCVGFSPRKANLVLYGLNSAPASAALIGTLGKVKTGAACLYINKLEDVDMAVLRELTRIRYQHMSTTTRSFVPR